jgi:hypothetical protein
MLVQVKKETRALEPVLKGWCAMARSSRPTAHLKRDPAIKNGFVPTELWSTVRLSAPIIYILGSAKRSCR